MSASYEIASKKTINNRKLTTVFNPPFTERIDSRPWKRNPSWLTLPEVSPSEQKFVGLYAVYPDSSFCALQVSTNTGSYNVDWGDGTQESVAASGVAYHVYDFNNSTLNGTNDPVTFDAGTNRVTLTGNKYVNGDIIMFDTVSSSTGIVSLTEYYVRNVSENTFQLSETETGSIVDILSNGSGAVLQYKQAIVTVTPISDNLLTRLNLQIRHTNDNAPYVPPWLDITLSLPEATIIYIGGGTMSLRSLEQATLHNLGKVTSLADLFFDCPNLVSVPYFNVPSTCTSLYRTFLACRSLYTIPEINAQNVTTLQQLFDGCYVLKEPISIINTSKVTNTSYMYRECYQLKRVPWIDTSEVTTMSYMFTRCHSLEEIPPMNTSKVTDLTQTFNACRRIKEIPNFNTSNVTSFNNTFVSCQSLEKVPLFDTSKATDITSIFNSCYSIEELPKFDFSKATSATSVFYNCYSLLRIPQYDFSSVTGSFNSVFYGCRSLKYIPDLIFGAGKITTIVETFLGCTSLVYAPNMDTSNVTSMSGTFNSCNSLQYIPVYDTSKVTNMTYVLNACFSLREGPKWNTSSLVTATGMFASCYTIEKIPEYDFTKVTTGNSLFISCYLLKEMPWILNMPLVTNTSNMFDSCVSLIYIPKVIIPSALTTTRMFYNTPLIEIPEIDFSSVTSFSETFNLTSALKMFKATGMKASFNISSHLFNANTLNQIYTNLATVSGQTITVTGCIGTANDDPSIATTKGWTVTG